MIAGLSFVVNLLISLFGLYSFPMFPGGMIDPWPAMFLFEVGLFARMAVVVSLVAYCVQWVVTLVSNIMARHRSVST